MTMLNRTARVKSALFSHIGGVGFFGGSVAPNVSVDAVEFDGCLKSVSVASNTKVAARVSWLRAALILHIHGCRNIAQVVESIVRSITVDVVNVSGRPAAAHEKPRKTVRSVQAPIDADANVSMRVFGPSNIADLRPKPLSGYQARENARFWIVMKKLAQTLRGKIVPSHDALLMLIGQRPACVSAHGGLRYFNGLHALLRGADCRSV